MGKIIGALAIAIVTAIAKTIDGNPLIDKAYELVLAAA